jgi:hypothetical protein
MAQSCMTVCAYVGAQTEGLSSRCSLCGCWVGNFKMCGDTPTCRVCHDGEELEDVWRYAYMSCVS